MNIDKLITTFDTGLRTLFAQPIASRKRPDSEIEDAPLSDDEKKQAAALMRINHVGEVCAQALYSGQALVSRDATIVNALKQAAIEETDHLAWCEQRIEELGGRKSMLNPIWYAGSFGLGTVAALLGDRWNLGFLAETEKQVEAHLASHLTMLSPTDLKTRKIVEQMQVDEREHAQSAHALGGMTLPMPVQFGMKFASKIMTNTAYYV
ncbi:MAG: demethoxyubiquinone hydroxylase family protein [Methylophilaceae bacterium 17-44-8]|jgi:ubiquinone biosynthesis monooxygenase Coq7|nr:MAG: demethoxyubiquinone hydroxylase family protein [Methylophilales bacterium 28-44-11]OYY96489.1 MAG: demethoxyubiquinone hydroxylase family protein [Methylophilales bacterium 16-45-7]OZA06521.1 MAG: demethoxyubiquinone hydroxylase family protein [Methylophilaceae bacterium 17-44-8]